MVDVHRREEVVRTYDLEGGTFLSAGHPEEVLLNAAWASARGLRVGDELVLTGALAGVPHVRIVGLLSDLGVGALQQGNVLVIDRTFLDEAFLTHAPLVSVDLVVQEGRAGDVEAALDREMTEPFVVETVADAQIQLSRAQQGFAGIAFLFGLVALVVGSFLVANTLAMTLTERTREVGLLRAAGTTSRQVLGLGLHQLRAGAGDRMFDKVAVRHSRIIG